MNYKNVNPQEVCDERTDHIVDNFTSCLPTETIIDSKDVSPTSDMGLACLVLPSLNQAFFIARYSDSARCIDALNLIDKYGHYVKDVIQNATSVFPACQVAVNNVKQATTNAFDYMNETQIEGQSIQVGSLQFA